VCWTSQAPIITEKKDVIKLKIFIKRKTGEKVMKYQITLFLIAWLIYLTIISYLAIYYDYWVSLSWFFAHILILVALTLFIPKILIVVLPDENGS